jgi:hypothetical protein
MRVIGYVSYAFTLIVRQLGGIQHVLRTSRLFKDQYVLEVVENIKQNYKLLVLVKKESNGLRDPVTSENIQNEEMYH